MPLYIADFSSDCDVTVRSFLTSRWQAVIIYMYYYDLFWKIWFLKVNVLTSNDLSLQCIGTESVYYAIAMHGPMLRVHNNNDCNTFHWDWITLLLHGLMFCNICKASQVCFEKQFDSTVWKMGKGWLKTRIKIVSVSSLKRGLDRSADQRC